MPLLRMISARSFYLYNIIILLSFLGENVFAVDDVGFAHLAVYVVVLVFVQAEAVALDHLAGFSLGREHCSVHRKEVQNAAGECFAGDLESGNPVEHVEEGALIKLAEVFGSTLSEEHLRC